MQSTQESGTAIFIKEIKQLGIDSRFFGHVKKREKAKKTHHSRNINAKAGA
jgi:hypothetical protein